MKLEDLQKVLESLKELEPNAETFSWGPTYECAEWRQEEAINLIKKGIKDAELKEAEFEKLKDAVEEFIAEHEMGNPHYLRDDEIISYFGYAKVKHVKRALKELR